MIKMFFSFIFVVIIAVACFVIYKGMDSNKNNVKNVSTKATELVSSVADTFSDGAKEIAKDVIVKASSVVDSAKSSASETIDSVKSGVKSRIGDVRKASKEKLMKAKASASNQIDTVKKKITE